MIEKIFLGTINIASQLQDFSKGFNRLGIPSITAVRYWTNAYQTDKGIDFCLGKENSKTFDRVYQKAIDECDTFLFIWNSFSEDSSDLRKLKKLGKRIIIFFVGSDIVWHKAQSDDFKNSALEPPQFSPDQMKRVSNLKKQISYIRNSEKYADLIITAPALSQLLIRPYLRGRHVIPNEKIIHNPIQRKKNPKIIFAPSNSVYKGERYFLDAVEKLRNEGLVFDLKLLQKEPYELALEKYSDADILVGELFYPGGGKQQREALAAGCVVLTNNDPNYKTYLPGNVPFIHVDINNLYDVLKETINNYELRCKYNKIGKQYTDKENNPEYACQEILDALNGKVELIKPTYYLNKIKLTKREYNIVKPWDDIVLNCAWFKKINEKIKYRIV